MAVSYLLVLAGTGKYQLNYFLLTSSRHEYTFFFTSIVSIFSTASSSLPPVWLKIEKIPEEVWQVFVYQLRKIGSQSIYHLIRFEVRVMLILALALAFGRFTRGCFRFRLITRRIVYRAWQCADSRD